MALTGNQLAQLWRQAAARMGGPAAKPGVANLMARIALRESSGQPGATNHNTNGSTDRGLWQINSIWGNYSRYGTLSNAESAVHVFNTQGPKAWSTYNPSTDQKYLGGFHSLAAPSTSGGRHRGPISPGSGSDSGAGAQSPAPSLLSSGGPGQASDFTGLLSNLLQHNQPTAPPSSPIAPPTFAAGPKLAQGLQPLDVQAPQQAGSGVPGIADLLSAISGSGGSSPQLPGVQPAGNDQNAAPGAPSAPARDTSATKHASTAGFHGSPVLELIHNDGAGRPGFGIKDGRTVNGSQVFSGVWAGHTNHVHVAASPKTVVALGRLAQSMGLHVGENPHFGGVTAGAHVPGSYHYRGMAIDVSGSPRLMDAFSRAVAKYNRTDTL